MAWIPRTTAPDVSNKYYRHTGYEVSGTDGVNECLIINRNTGFVMPNCVGYSWGRWYEALGIRPDLSRGNANTWYANTGDGYARGRVPRLGAIACYSGNGTGHVAVIEELVNGQPPITSNSAYGGTLFWLEALTYDPDTGDWNTRAPGYIFQGFIYPPFIPDRDPIWMLKQAASRRLPNGRDKNAHLWR